MHSDRDRSRPQCHHEGTVTTAVLAIGFAVCMVWGLFAGWDAGSVAAMVTGAALMGVLTTASARRGDKPGS